MKRLKGFTLIELTISMFTGIIVIVVAGMIMFFGQKSWNNTWDRTNLQRDASYAMLKMTRVIKAGSSAHMEENGDCLQIYNEEGWTRFFATLGSAKLSLKSEIGENNFKTIIDSNVEAVQFNVVGNLVTIDLKLKKNNLETHFVSTVMMRNYGQ